MRRIRRRPVRGARVRARFYGAEVVVETDRDGYFRVEMAPGEPMPREQLWHRLDLALLAPRRAEAWADVFIPPERARVVVVSDIDDTVMHTGVVNKAAMLWRLFVRGGRQAGPCFRAYRRSIRALHAGVRGTRAIRCFTYRARPGGFTIFWRRSFSHHAIPAGPVLFLREWGISWRSPLPRRAVDHKRLLIEAMMDLYADMPFVLIGDSGQHDPEIYRRIVERYNGRVQGGLHTET